MPTIAVFCLSLLVVALQAAPASAQSLSPPPAAATASGAEATAAAQKSEGEVRAEPQPGVASAAAPQPDAASASQPAPNAAGQAAPAADSAATGTPPAEDPFRGEVLKQIESAKLARDEKTALSAFYQNRDKGLWVDEQGLNARARLTIAEIGRADDWGLNAADFVLPEALPPGSPPAAQAAAELTLMGAALKYASHARGGRMEPTQLSYAIDREPPLLTPLAVLEGIAAAEAPDAYLRGLHPRHPQFEKLRQAYLTLRQGGTPSLAEPAEEAASAGAGRGGKARKQASPPEQLTARKILINMEQWRWMPEHLGDMYVWANIPEFMVRVIKGGRVIHVERIVAGKPDTPTPIFSDEMETIVFHPFWGVPDSIKVKELLPGLARGGAVLEKNNLRMQYRGRDIDPASVDWSSVDIRRFHIYQPPGGGNVLGVVKFLFPNKHQVYMHDTPTKNLFNATQRSFSHGCMRVRNPVRLAEVLLAEDKSWDARKVASLVNGGPQNNEVSLQRKFPVHVTYFTAWVDDEGKLNARPDVYGHERLIQMGLEGKAHLIVKRKEDLSVARAEVVGRLAETKSNWSPSPSWMKNLFNF